MSKPPPMSALGFRGHHALTPTVAHPGSSETDEPPTPGSLTRQPSQDLGDRQNALPTLSHRLKHNSSILSIALSDEEIYAGTQAGEILVYSLSTYEKLSLIHI